MALQSHLKLELNVLKLSGFRWEADKPSFFQVSFSFVRVLGFCVIFAYAFFAPDEMERFLIRSNFAVLILYSVRVIVSSVTLLLFMALSMFYQKAKRLKFYQACDCYQDSMNSYGKKLKSKERRKVATLFFVILFHTCMMIWSQIKFQYGVLRGASNILFSFGNHLMYQNQCFLNEILSTLSEYFELTKELIKEKKLSLKEILFLKLKLQKIMGLLNDSFGLLMLYSVLITFFNLTCNYYLTIGKTSAASNVSYNLWYLVVLVDNLPLNFSRFLLFHTSNKIKQQERLLFFLSFHSLISKQFFLTDWRPQQSRRKIRWYSESFNNFVWGRPQTLIICESNLKIFA